MKVNKEETKTMGSLWTLTSAGLISNGEQHGKVFGDNAADGAEKEEDDDECEDPVFEGNGQYLGIDNLPNVIKMYLLSFDRHQNIVVPR